jgi:ubiquinone/menaquinone biosynthesis C-methylase UbiE
VVHNLPDANHRHQALDEMLRVWRPGGVLVLADIANIAEYRAYLTSSGLNDL